jgi:hypothetical protein
VGVSDELLWLLHQIRGTASPVERLRLLARGWRSVRALSADDRRSLARELGFDGAEQMIDQLARRGGMSPSNLLSVLQRAEEADPAAVMDEVRGLIEPGRSREAAGELLDAVAEVIVDDGGQVLATSSAALPAEKKAAVDRPPSSGVDSLARGEPAPPAVSLSGAAPKHSPPAERVAPAGPDGSRTGAAGPTLSPGRFRRRLAGPEKSAIQPSTPAATRAAERGDARPGAAELTGGRRPDSGVELAAALSGEASLLRRLRRLSASTELLAGAGLEGFAAVLECFPSGWARRRALERLLAAGLPESVTDAIALLELLVRPFERMWALTTLAASRPLDDRAREALLAAAPSPALRRRLRRRQGDSGR